MTDGTEPAASRRESPPPVDAAVALTLREYVLARWVLVGVLAALCALHELRPELLGFRLASESSLPLWAVVAVLAALNVVSARATARGRRARVRVAAAHLLVDVVGLSAFLAAAGGAQNPFTILYFVPITLATQLPRGFTWALGAAGLVGFGLLFFVTPNLGLPWSASDPAEAMGHTPEQHARMMQAMHGGHAFADHMTGMWVALAISGAMITFFTHRISSLLARHRSSLARLEKDLAEDRYLASLGALAASAGHELGTPLGTIRLLVDELPELDDRERAATLDVIREELERCKAIVHDMRNPELSASAFEDAARWTLGELVEAVNEELGEARANTPVQVRVAPSAQLAECSQPRFIVVRVVRELVKNSLEACAGRVSTAGVSVSVDVFDDRAKLEVSDDGKGLSADEARDAFRPLHTTKPGGMGLGLYLARAHLRQLGGDLTLTPQPQGGAVALAEFPLMSSLGRRA